MTMQIPDTVIYNDAAYETGAYCADLLKPYLEKHHIELFADCSALWRGYIATWKIENGMLYLTEIYANAIGVKGHIKGNESTVKGHIKGNESTIQSLLSDEAVGMDYLFPNQSKVFADWYSGILPIHNENASKEESKYLIFKISKGHIIGQEQLTEQEYYNYPSYR